MGFTKLHESIVHSSIWDAPDTTRLVWITMLAIKDKNGEIAASVPGLAHLARVSVEACEKALEYLSSPDRYSRTPDNAGRRIEAIDGGWVVLNSDKYRELQSIDDKREQARIRQQRKRERDKSQGVTPAHAKSHHADADTDTDPKPWGSAPAIDLDQERPRHPLVDFYRSKFPDVPEDQIEQSILKLKVGWSGIDLMEAISEAWKSAAPDLPPYKVHTWVNRQCQILSDRRRAADEKTGRGPALHPAVRAVLDATREAPERASRETYNQVRKLANAVLKAGERVPDAAKWWLSNWKDEEKAG